MTQPILPPTREALQARLDHGDTYAEMAQAYGVCSGTVVRWVQRLGCEITSARRDLVAVRRRKRWWAYTLQSIAKAGKAQHPTRISKERRAVADCPALSDRLQRLLELNDDD